MYLLSQHNNTAHNTTIVTILQRMSQGLPVSPRGRKDYDNRISDMLRQKRVVTAVEDAVTEAYTENMDKMIASIDQQAPKNLTMKVNQSIAKVVKATMIGEFGGKMSDDAMTAYIGHNMDTVIKPALLKFDKINSLAQDMANNRMLVNGLNDELFFAEEERLDG